MTAPWSAIAGWFRAHNITSHVIAGGLLSFLGAFARDEQLRNFLLSFLGNHPVIVADLATAACLYLKYSGSHSASGVMGMVPAAERTLEKEAPPKH